MSLALTTYRGLITVVGPFASAWLQKRAKAGKEDPARLRERFGYYAEARPPGRLVWLHAASVGESGVALQLVNALADRDPALSFLITTGTRTSAALIGKRVSARLRHAYVPLDRPDAVKRFLAHWRPDLGLFVESELWPNLILAAQRAAIPLALVNARMSPETLGRWTRWPDAARRVLDAFAMILAADQRTADALCKLTAAPTIAVGNLKLAAPAPAIDAAANAALKAVLNGRPVWLAASTHAGEEAIARDAHRVVREALRQALLIIVPRHPERGGEIQAEIGGARRAAGEPIGAHDIYIADTLGELGVFYANADAAFIGGSLVPTLKGHNAIEAAKLNTPIIAGPHVESFADLYDDLLAAGGAARVDSSDTLAAEVLALLRDPALRAQRTAAAQRVVDRGSAALDATIARIAALLPAPVQDARADASA